MPRNYGVTNVAPYASAPPVGAAGDEYWLSTTKTLYISDGTSWNPVSGSAGPAYAEIAATPPTAASPPAIVPPMGLLWVDTSIANPTTNNLPYFPPQTPPVSGFNSFTDSAGTVWVSYNGSAWKQARDALHAKVIRNGAYTVPAGGWYNIVFDTVVRDPMAMWSSPQTGFIAPITGMYLISALMTVTPAGSPTTGQFMGAQTTVAGVQVSVTQVHQSMSFAYATTAIGSAFVTAGQLVQGGVYCTISCAIQNGNNVSLSIDYMGTG